MAYSGEHHSDKSQPQIWPPTQAKKCHFHLLNHASSQSVAWSISIFGWFSQPTENMQLQIIIPHYHKDIARTTKHLNHRANANSTWVCLKIGAIACTTAMFDNLDGKNDDEPFWVKCITSIFEECAHHLPFYPMKYPTIISHSIP